MKRWKLLKCAIFGHDKKRTKYIGVRLMIPGAGWVTCGLCFRCDHLFEAEGVEPTFYLPCQHESILDADVIG